jgi:hypothetical protein
MVVRLALLWTPTDEWLVWYAVREYSTALCEAVAEERERRWMWGET